MEEVRLQKYMAECGIASRRKCEEYIENGLVKVNGNTVTELGIKINPNKDIVEYNGKKVENTNTEKIYILLNKPIGYVTTAKDQFSRKTVLDLINVKERIVPVGRLDMYTSGALILTNDGEFVYKITHPKYKIEKTYNATIKGLITNEDIKKLEQGIKIEDYITSSTKAKILKIDTIKNVSRVQISIHEGKNREVRKMFETIGYKVVALHRVKIGNIDLKDIKIGEWRYLKKEEVEKIKKYIHKLL